jgi:hypothetical protein
MPCSMPWYEHVTFLWGASDIIDTSLHAHTILVFFWLRYGDLSKSGRVQWLFWGLGF